MIKNLLNLFFYNDEYCYFCKEEKITRDYLCENCIENLRKYNVEIFKDYEESEFKKDILYFYSGILKEKVKNFKFKDDLYLKYPLGKLIYNALDKELLKEIDYITYVPISKRKMRKRGYNQCELLAREISKLTGIKVIDCIEKITDTKDQHSLTLTERSENLKGVFKVIKNIENKKILLIDDIHTSGNTIDECYKIMKKSGVKFVWTVCICGVR